MDVSFIGSGNLAWHLAPALDNAGYVVREVYSQNPKHAAALTERLYQAEVKASLDFSTSRSNLFVICVSDSAIRDVVTEIILPEDSILVHTSGSMPLSLLDLAASSATGVIYPLQTFSKHKKVEFRNVPFFIESNDPETEILLMGIAKALSVNVRKITSDERQALHVAAVFASNFSNYMLTLSKDILQENSMDFDLVKPLIQETIQKVLTIGPELAQTGPAMRGDLETLDQHLEALKDKEHLLSVYKLLSQQIIDRYQG